MIWLIRSLRKRIRIIWRLLLRINRISYKFLVFIGIAFYLIAFINVTELIPARYSAFFHNIVYYMINYQETSVSFNMLYAVIFFPYLLVSTFLVIVGITFVGKR